MAVSVLLHGPLHIGKICNGCVCVGSIVHYTMVGLVTGVSVLAPLSITRWWGSNGCVCVGSIVHYYDGGVSNGCVCVGSIVHYTMVGSVTGVSVLAPLSITQRWGQ